MELKLISKSEERRQIFEKKGRRKTIAISPVQK